jgi:hypothetical protein
VIFLVTFTESSFTIQFPEHLPHDKQQYCLDRLSESGASLQPQSERVFRVVCRKPNELASVGWAIFHTHFAKICRVIGTSGSAEAQATAYPKPSK